jgi:hypothetical protein
MAVGLTAAAVPVGVRMFGVEGKKSLAVAYADWTNVCTAEYARPVIMAGEREAQPAQPRDLLKQRPAATTQSYTAQPRQATEQLLVCCCVSSATRQSY